MIEIRLYGKLRRQSAIDAIRLGTTTAVQNLDDMAHRWQLSDVNDGTP
jgi:hypothetical protein